MSTGAGIFIPTFTGSDLSRGIEDEAPSAILFNGINLTVGRMRELTVFAVAVPLTVLIESESNAASTSEGSSLLIVGELKAVTERITLSSATRLTSLGSGASSVCPVVAKSLALSKTARAGLRLGTGCGSNYVRLMIEYVVRIGGMAEENIVHIVTGACIPSVKVDVYAGESITVYSVGVRAGCKESAVDVVVSSYYVLLAIHYEEELNLEPLGSGAALNEVNGKLNGGTRVVYPNVSLIAGNNALGNDRLNINNVSSDTVLGVPTVSVVKKNGEYVLRVCKIKLKLEGHSADTLVACVELLEAGLGLRKPYLHLSCACCISTLNTSFIGDCLPNAVLGNNLVSAAVVCGTGTNVVTDRGAGVATNGSAGHIVAVEVNALGNNGEGNVTLRTSEGCIGGNDVMTVILAVRFFTNFTNCKSVTGCGAANVTKSLALSAAAKLTSHRKYASSLCVVVTVRGNFAYSTTSVTYAGIYTSSLGPIVAERAALSNATAVLTGLCLGTSSVCKVVSKSLTLGFTTVETNLGKYTSSLGPVVTYALAFGRATIETGLGILAVSGIPGMTVCYALGAAADLTGLRKNTGSFHPVVTGCGALCFITLYAILSISASCLDPGVAKCLTAGLAAKLTGSGSFAASCFPLMLKRIAFSFATYGTGLGRLTGSLSPSMAKSLALGLAALTSLGRLTSSVCPYVLVLRFCLNAKPAEHGILSGVKATNNGVLNAGKRSCYGLGKHITGSECEQKDH